MLIDKWTAKYRTADARVSIVPLFIRDLSNQMNMHATCLARKPTATVLAGMVRCTSRERAATAMTIAVLLVSGAHGRMVTLYNDRARLDVAGLCDHAR